MFYHIKKAMRIAFWNVRGLGKPYRRGLVRNHILQEDIHIFGLQETIKQDFSNGELKEMSGNRVFQWFWILAKGHSGGLALGINSKNFEVEDVCSIAALVRNRRTNFRFWVVNVYGPAQHEFSAKFVRDISSFCSRECLPILMGGDFNLIRSNKERNQGLGDQRLMDLFNEFIGNFHLSDIFVSGNKFTWSNKQRNPTLVRLDRILASGSWEENYPTCFVWAKARIDSDHCPILLDSGEHGATRPRNFFFENHWFQQEGFKSLVEEKWKTFQDRCRRNTYSMDRWHGCLVELRKFLRGWNLRLIGLQKTLKGNICHRIQELDKVAEGRLLSMEEWDERVQLENRMEDISRNEELFCKQRAGDKWILQGDSNTHFFTNLLMAGEGRILSPFWTLIRGRLGDKRRLLLILWNIINICLDPTCHVG